MGPIIVTALPAYKLRVTGYDLALFWMVKNEFGNWSSGLPN
ncbi:MAG: hypothetical protein ACFB11_21690 [Paracoccaceae bacterium]